MNCFQLYIQILKHIQKTKDYINLKLTLQNQAKGLKPLFQIIGYYISLLISQTFDPSVLTTVYLQTVRYYIRQAAHYCCHHFHYVSTA